MSHRVERGTDGQSSVVISLLWNKIASGGGVITANEAIDQTRLLRTQRGIGLPKLQCFAFWLLGRGRLLLIRLRLGKNQLCRYQWEKDEKEQLCHTFHRSPPGEKVRIEKDSHDR